MTLDKFGQDYSGVSNKITYGISVQGRVFFQKLINAHGCHSTVHYYGIKLHRARFSWKKLNAH